MINKPIYSNIQNVETLQLLQRLQLQQRLQPLQQLQLLQLTHTNTTCSNESVYIFVYEFVLVNVSLSRRSNCNFYKKLYCRGGVIVIIVMRFDFTIVTNLHIVDMVNIFCFKIFKIYTFVCRTKLNYINIFCRKCFGFISATPTNIIPKMPELSDETYTLSKNKVYSHQNTQPESLRAVLQRSFAQERGVF